MLRFNPLTATLEVVENSASANTANSVVKRDASGNFSAGTITANLLGNATTATTATSATSATSFTGPLLGDVTGTQGATVVSFVAASSAANVHSAELLANAATASNTNSAIVRRDGSGNFSAGTITASLSGNATTATTATTATNNVLRAGDTMTGAFKEAVVTLSDAATIAVDASLGNIFTVTLGGNRTLGAPTNPTSGQKIVVRVRQDGTGGRTLAYDSVYRFGADIPTPVLSVGINKTDYLGFIYHATDVKWDCIAFTRNY